MAWASQSLACIIASMVGGYIVENSEARYSFYMYSAVSISVALTALKMSKDLEVDLQPTSETELTQKSGQ